MKTKLVTLFAIPLLSSLLHGQDLINFSAVSDTPTTHTGGANIFRSTELGVNNDTLSFNAFNVTVGSGTGAAEGLVGQSFLALCINLRYESPAANLDYVYSNGSELLSYNPTGSGDFWNNAREAKYTAINNVIAALGSNLVAMDQSGPEFQEWMVAMSFALSEIIADYDGTVGSLSLTAGNNQFSYISNGQPVDGSIYSKYQQAIGYISTAAAPGSSLRLATIDNSVNQDVILIPVPEPSMVSLAGLMGALGLLRRRRL